MDVNSVHLNNIIFSQTITYQYIAKLVFKKNKKERKSYHIIKQIPNSIWHHPVKMMLFQKMYRLNTETNSASGYLHNNVPYVRPLSINKLQIQSNIHASLRASDEFKVLNDQMSGKNSWHLALDGIHSTREGRGEAEAHSPLSVSLRSSHFVLDVKVPEHLLLLLKSLQAFIIKWFGSFCFIVFNPH